MNLKSETLKQRPDLNGPMNQMISENWPEVALNDNLANQYWFEIQRVFREFQEGVIDTDTGDLVAVLNTVPLRWDGKLEDLPDEGWDWAVASAIRGLKEKITPNILCALSITISSSFKKKGISSKCILMMKEIAKRNNLDFLIAPVRPTLKHQYPLLALEDYIQWKTSDLELPFDPWLRTHIKVGGKILKVCSRCMVTENKLENWEKWTGMRFLQSGEYIVPYTLNPIQVCLDSNKGIYIEPGVWMVHL